MTGLGEQLRRTVRASGWVAIVGVVLFGIGGLLAVTAQEGPRPPRESTVTPAGEALDVEAGTRGLLWGTGAELRPEAVTCTWLLDAGGTNPLDMTYPEPRFRLEDPVRGDQVVLAEFSHAPAGQLTCDGGGLEQFARGDLRQGPSARVFGVFLLAFAGVSALWAVVTLRRTHRQPGA